ncbi:MAG TPA: glycoside hydrolase family 16 protein [Acidobacteriota bacterium]|nr:glycoside hydrolase family 16 protein [Acidobacteriota bacterium]
MRPTFSVLVPICLTAFSWSVAATRFFPQVADGTLEGIRLRSSVILLNTGQPTEVELALFRSDGSPWTPDLGVEPCANGRFRLEIVSGGAVRLTTPGDPQNIAVGYAVLEAPDTVEGTVVFAGYDAESGVSLFEAGVPATTPCQELSVFADTLGSMDTGLALVNAGTQTAELTYRLWDKERRLLAQRTGDDLKLEAGHHTARFVTELFRPGDVETGVEPAAIRETEGVLEVLSSGAAVSAVTLRQLVSGGTFPPIVPVLTTFPVVPRVAAEVPEGWRLVWADEFDGDRVDPVKWEFQIGTGTDYGLPAGWGNNELQYYTDRQDNAFVADGKLHIVAKKESYGRCSYTSARLRTLGKGDWTYGRFEIRAKLPKGKGIWPALWMLPTDNVYGGWAASGEIDIMELVGHEPNVVHGTLHYGGPWPRNKSSGGSYRLAGGDFSQDFHVFALEWEPGEIRWFVDGELYLTLTQWYTEAQGASFPAPFDQRFHLLMNVAVGGNWPGSPAPTTQFPQEMVVDYVRVYQAAP